MELGLVCQLPLGVSHIVVLFVFLIRTLRWPLRRPRDGGRCLENLVLTRNRLTPELLWGRC